ncbi:hypothetical protein H3Z83_09230 [Tenacibaculum sp. S7007]|uniref:Fibronectin type-III domain-containing protein n=1 Tax=Tenacibaculum pelagium TaxID=2759527 RepID=A0A839ARD1_9FLAO|nr:hypothetical protein [Tenacibaculum pelagium]MBA6156694.1 hypothetical protein [Tenacibaculum pelagium]
MRKVIKTIALFSLPLFVACGGGSKEPVNEAPSKVNLVYPTPNLLCIDNTITFDWSDATDPNNDNISYKVEISKNREMSNIVKSQTASTSQVNITLDKGTALYWRVTAIDAKGLAGETSSVNAFYTKGEGETNSAPFTAKLVSPSDEKSTDANASNQVVLTWEGADSDNDTLKYDLFFGESSDFTSAFEENLTTESKEVTVESGKTYYWKVNSIDPSNAKSIGQVWSFTVN